MTSTTYIVRDYADASALGEITLTDEQFGRYERDAQQPGGLMPIRELLSIGGEYVPSDVVADNRTIYLD